jgi:hypothetical protein
VAAHSPSSLVRPQLPGSNAVNDSKAVQALMAQLKKSFPPDMDYAISLDQTKAVTEGIREIVVTLGTRRRFGRPPHITMRARSSRSIGKPRNANCASALISGRILQTLRPSPGLAPAK